MISESTTKETPLHGESNIDNKKTYDLPDFILKSRGDKETHNIQIINDEEYQCLIESRNFFFFFFYNKWDTQKRQIK